jgi:propionyl-CoA carboxylase alpha chain
MGGAPLDRARVTEAELPLLVKAAAGGGGRGMRIVRELASLDAELAAAGAEAASAFGDGEVFLEPYIEQGRHVEVQVLADAYGTVWALGTRDCSLQRRHQKVIEESPAPGLEPALVAELHESAIGAARAVGYRGAGTVEFLVASGSGPAHFLEMNTRLQVEHPVTEAVFGIDLVALQLRVAEGAALPKTPPTASGHAVEARLYAEDPSKGWAPQTGVLHALEVPGAGAHPLAGGGAAGWAPPTGVLGAMEVHGVGGHPLAAGGAASAFGGLAADGLAAGGPGFRAGGGVSHAANAGAGAHPLAADGATSAFGGPAEDSPALRAGAGTAHALAPNVASPAAAPWVRVDTGYAAGDSIGVHYDPLIAKVIAYAPTRAEAVRRLAHALRRARVHGPVTNRELLVRSLEHPDFTDAGVGAGAGTGAGTARLDTGFYDRNLDALTVPAPGERVAAIAAAIADAARHPGASVVSRLGGWRNVPSTPQLKVYGDHEVRYRATRDGFDLVDAPGIRVTAAAPDRVSLEVDGVVRHFHVTDHHDGRIHVDSPTGAHRLLVRPRFPDPEERTEPGSLLAPMPGTVVRIGEGLAAGVRVTQGQPLVWLEAMKMEHRIVSPASGTLTALHAVPGRQVEVGALLAVVQAAQAVQEDMGS